MKTITIALLALSSVIFLIAATATRAYVGTSNVLWMLLSLSLYVVGNLIMVKIMRDGGLGVAISISSIAQLVLINVIAFVLYGERLSNIQMSGVGLGLVAMTLMMWPEGGFK
jgi:small multidrug resistance pump